MSQHVQMKYRMLVSKTFFWYISMQWKVVYLWDVAWYEQVKVLGGYVKATSMHTKVTAEAGIKPCCYKNSQASSHGQPFWPCLASSAWHSEQMSSGFPHDQYECKVEGRVFLIIHDRSLWKSTSVLPLPLNWKILVVSCGQIQHLAHNRQGWRRAILASCPTRDGFTLQCSSNSCVSG